LAALRPNPYQPRRDFDQASLAELADSIRVHGIVEPIVVCPSKDGSGGHFVVAGERRLRAAQLAGLSEAPCIYREVTRQEMLELALVENIHREDLNPMERATALRDMMVRFALTQQQVAERVGQPRATVANYLRLLDLCTEVQQMVRQGSLSLGHAKVLAGLAGQVGPQLALAGRCVSENLSVRQLEELVRQAQAGQAVQPQPPARERSQRPPYLLDVERQLTQVVGTKVAIKPGRAKHTGKIVIDYYSLEDFDRIAAALGVSIES
jgi:ParB family chromosome partitioning protein